MSHSHQPTAAGAMTKDDRIRFRVKFDELVDQAGADREALADFVVRNADVIRELIDPTVKGI